MKAEPTRGKLVFSVDLELDAAQRSRIDPSHLDATAASLLELFERFQLPATWGVADPCHSAATDAIARATPRHEIAILGDDSWIGPAAGRKRFARELARRVEGSRAANLPVTTLLARNANLSDHFDLVAKHQLTALRGGVTPNCRSETRDPTCLRYGIWDLPPQAVIPGSSRWLPGGGGGWNARAIIRQAARAARLAHLVIDAPRLAENQGRGLGIVESVLRLAAKLGEQGHLGMLTLREAARQLSQRPQVVPLHSILRAAA